MYRNTVWRIALCLASISIPTLAQAFPQPGSGKSGAAPSRNATLPTQNFSRTPLTHVDAVKRFDTQSPPKEQAFHHAETKHQSVQTLPKVFGPNNQHEAKRDLATMPALRLHQNSNFNAQDLAKIKPMIDLSKVRPSEVLAKRPPHDFRIRKLDLAKIHVPANAHTVARLNAGHSFQGQSFILNQHRFQGSNYHLLHGTRFGNSWCYQGIHHNHWHHCIWDPCYRCYYYYDPCLCCYYYYNVTETCYYPCWWFVNYCDTYYPWWTCGGFQSVGYQLPRVQVGIRFGW